MMETLKSNHTYYGIQALRAIAALMVVLVHADQLWVDRVVHRTESWTNGASGVDIFFVISGFVMTVSLPGLRKFGHRVRVFFWRRLTRIVPLYWLATTLKVVLLLAAPGLAVHRGINPWNVLCSYLFIPSANEQGVVVPVVVVGWTLNFEMFFYLLFAGSMFIRFPPFLFLIPSLAILASIGPVFHPPLPIAFSLISPMLFEFLFGIFIGLAALRDYFPSKWASTTLVVSGFVLILSLFPRLAHDVGSISQWRFLIWGLPAAAIVAGTIGLESTLSERLPKWVVFAGNASYAIYLVQTFVLPVVGVFIERTHLGGIPALATSICVGLPLSLIAGCIVHRFVELPILAHLKRIHIPGVSTLPA